MASVQALILLGDDYLQRNAAGDSTINMADYAIALVDEILDEQHEKAAHQCSQSIIRLFC